MGRFNIIFDIGKPLYAKDTKIAIKKAALTTDNETGKVFAQIKMENLLSKTLIAVKVMLTGYNVSGEKIEEKEFIYHDLNVKQGEEFGQKTPVEFQNSTVCSFNIKIAETEYSDGTKLTDCGTEYCIIPEPEPLTNELTEAEIKQYEKSNNISSAEYIVTEFSDLWICTCGKMSTTDNGYCYSCGASRENLKSSLDKDLLDEKCKGADSVKMRKKKAGIFAGAAAFCAVIVLLFSFLFIPLIRNANNIRKADVGDTVVFGDYHGSNEWIVLDKRDGKTLLISKYCLDAKEYNTRRESVTWEDSSIRKWLNEEFIIESFSKKEQIMICDTYLQNQDNPEYGTNGGNGTIDKVFLLSIDEATKYFANDEARKGIATDYANENGAWVLSSAGYWWWLRSPGKYQDYGTYVGSEGSIYCEGNTVNGGVFCVRPAMWINVG